MYFLFSVCTEYIYLQKQINSSSSKMMFWQDIKWAFIAPPTGDEIFVLQSITKITRIFNIKLAI